jgi:ABC-type nitrate/sulfonate/bicarbonate transport system substrate-binding protein
MDRLVHTDFVDVPRSSPALRMGYVPLTHAAPLLVAHELGLFARHGLRVQLSREVGWATVREKVLSGELDAAQALAPLPLAMTLGLNSARVDCLTALVLTLHGNAIVLSRRLWSACRAEPAALVAEAHRRADPVTFAVVYPHSSQLFMLREWLGRAGLMPERDYRLVVVPPPQMVTHLRAGHIDGFCVGEPWASLAVCAGVGVLAAFSADLAPGHAEKVLLVRRTFAEERAAEHAALIRVLLQACRWCADPAHREDVIGLLSGRGGLAVPAEAVRPALTGDFDLGDGRRGHRPDAVVFSGEGVNEPSLRRVAWFARHVEPSMSPERLARIYRTDLFQEACSPQPRFSPVPSREILTCNS